MNRKSELAFVAKAAAPKSEYIRKMLTWGYVTNHCNGFPYLFACNGERLHAIPADDLENLSWYGFKDSLPDQDKGRYPDVAYVLADHYRYRNTNGHLDINRADLLNAIEIANVFAQDVKFHPIMLVWDGYKVTVSGKSVERGNAETQVKPDFAVVAGSFGMLPAFVQYNAVYLRDALTGMDKSVRISFRNQNAILITDTRRVALIQGLS